MENLRLREAAPTSVNVTVGKRSREYLTDREVERPHRGRQAEPLWASGRHGYFGRLPARPQSLGAGCTALGDIDLATGRMHVRRVKSGDASVHPISARESRALRKLLREAPPSPYVFISPRETAKADNPFSSPL